MRIELSERVAGVAPERALAWWTDFRDGHTDHAFAPGARRTVFTAGPAGARVRDRVVVLGVTLFREDWRAWREGRAVRFRGENTVSRFDGEYRFEPDGAGGTRITLDAAVELRAPLRWSEPVARLVARAILRADLRGHARELGDDLAPRPR